jgi:hypothetical protein
MPELDDQQLLREFAATNSEAAFATLVARHVNLVYSSTLRFGGNPHRAEEVTQAVFILLARKAGSLGGKTVLSGWLYQTARLTAANVVKSEIRRQRREQEAYMQPHPAASGMIPSQTGYPKTADQAATAILEAWGKGDWNGFEDKFAIPGSPFATLPEPLKKLTPGMQVLSVGNPDNSSVSNMWLLPCKVRLKDGEVKEFVLFLKQTNDRWIFNGFNGVQ